MDAAGFDEGPDDRGEGDIAGHRLAINVLTARIVQVLGQVNDYGVPLLAGQQLRAGN